MKTENQIKNEILQQVIDMMEQKMTDDLKGKSPKFMKVETNDPDMAEKVIEGAMEETPDSPEEDEDLVRLKEQYAKLK